MFSHSLTHSLGILLVAQSEQPANLFADCFWILAQVNQGVDDDAARFDRIKQAVASRADNKTPHRFLEQWRDLGMNTQMLEREIEFLNKTRAGAFAAVLQIGEDVKQVVSAPCFQTISGMAPAQESSAQLFPAHAAFGMSVVLIPTTTQQLN